MSGVTKPLANGYRLLVCTEHTFFFSLARPSPDYPLISALSLATLQNHPAKANTRGGTINPAT